MSTTMNNLKARSISLKLSKLKSLSGVSKLKRLLAFLGGDLFPESSFHFAILSTFKVIN